jgi:hypothetical protein
MTHDSQALRYGMAASMTSEVEGDAMSTMDSSLRLLIEKWLGSNPTMPARVIRGHTHSNRRRYVCVEALRPTGALTIYFFRHDDGMWCIYPPEVKRPTMSFS